MIARRNWLIGAAAAAAGASGFTARLLTRSPTADGVDALNALALPDLNGATQRLAQWQGKVRVVNFWATWCQPCREEIPGLLRIEKKHAGKNLQLVGIAVDEVAKIRQFAIEYKMDYPQLVGGSEIIDLSRKLGNRAGGLPFTAVLNSGGELVRFRLGRMEEAELDALITPLLS